MKNIMEKVVSIEEFKAEVGKKEQIITTVHTEKQMIVYADMGAILQVETGKGTFKNINHYKAELDRYKKQYTRPLSKEVLA